MHRCLIVVEVLLMVPVLFTLWAETVGRLRRWLWTAERREEINAKALAALREHNPKWDQKALDSLGTVVRWTMRAVAVVCAVAVWVLRG